MTSYEASELVSRVMKDVRAHSMYTAVVKTLARRKYRDDYDSVKAVKAFRNVADEAARGYGMEVYGKYGVPPEFPQIVRDEAAFEMRDGFEAAFENGDYAEYKQKYLRNR